MHATPLVKCPMKSDKDADQVELNGFKKKIMTEQDKQFTNSD